MRIKILVIGGVAGGATAAARARRLSEEAEIIVFERGPYISFANCGLPYYVGEVIPNRDDLLVTTPDAFRKRYNIDVRNDTEITAIHRDAKEVEAIDHLTGRTYRESYDTIILSPGAEPFKPPITGIDLEGVYQVRTIPDSDRIKAVVDTHRPESAVVVGGGFIGLEMAENLVRRGVRTTIVEALGQVMPPLDVEVAAIVQAHLKENGIDLRLGAGVKSFEARNGKIAVETHWGEIISGDMVILSIGVRPESKLAREAGLELSERGAIKVNAEMRTSDPDIFAVGDAVEVIDLVTGQLTSTALAGPANKQARLAADNALGRKSLFKGTLGTAIVKVFGLTVAGVGANEKKLQQLGWPFRVSYTHSGSHASYYPGSSLMSIKLLFRPGDGQILGAQIVGEDGVDKRIDVLATAISARMTVFDLEELELAYAPPYSSAKDPVNVAGFVAANMLRGDLETVDWNEFDSLDDETVLLDVRNQDELENVGRIPGALHVPLSDLRDALSRLDRGKDYAVFCALGFRGYLAHRILVQHGFKSRNLSGGFRTYIGAKEEIMKEAPKTRDGLSEQSSKSHEKKHRRLHGALKSVFKFQGEPVLSSECHATY